MTIDKDKLIKLIDDNLDIVYNDKDMDGLVKVANEIIKFFAPSVIKEKLYKGIIARELKGKYRFGSNDEDKMVNQCSSCGKIATLEEGILVQGHHRKCPTAQLERVLAI